MKPNAKKRKSDHKLSSEFPRTRQAGDPIPQSVYQAAAEFSKGTDLKELKIANTATFSSDPEDNSIVRVFLETLLKEGSEAALVKLESRLLNDPLSLAHPVVWS